ncbi:MAG TPA: hypothetical protein PKM88_12715 [bacterium]|nr:hypothetical protein [bacterium]
MTTDRAESAPATSGGLGGKLGDFFAGTESAPASDGNRSHNWRDRINYAGRRTRVAHLQRRQRDDD